MHTDTTSAASATFVGQPGPGRGGLRCAISPMASPGDVSFMNPVSLRVRFPSPEADGLSAVFVNTAGGVAGGDHFAIDIAAGEGARLTLTTGGG